MRPWKVRDVPERLQLLAAAGGACAHIPTKRKPKAAPKPTVKEADLQAQAEELCALLGIRFFRLPDTLLAHLAQSHEAWVRVFCGRYLKGVPDLLMFRPLPGGDNLCRMLEIKREDGKLRQGQREWHKGLDVRTAYGWSEVEREIRGFAALTPGGAAPT